jgi:hypothetical protein
MYSSTKDRVQGMVVGMFGAMYVVKAMTRFSMAMVGCPVTVKPKRPAAGVFETVIDDIKIVIFPARRGQTIRIEAYDDGELSATVLRPGQAGCPAEVDAIRWEGPVRKQEQFDLEVPATKICPRERSRPRPCRLVAITGPAAEGAARRVRWSVQRVLLRDGISVSRSNSEAER